MAFKMKGFSALKQNDESKNFTASDTTRVRNYRKLKKDWGVDPADYFARKVNLSNLNPELMKKFESIVKDKKLSSEMGEID